jgi:hypothetical protein
MKQYLDYAIEIEELFHLSNIDTSNDPTRSRNPTSPAASAITFRHSNPPSTPTHHITIASISGLKWVDDYRHPFSAIHQLHSPHISSRIASSKSIMCLIGSNSLRIFPASRVLTQMQDFLSVLRQNHPHLSSQQSICIVTTFPCGKPSNTFPTSTLLQRNIDLYNNQLQTLSTHLNFTVIDFQIKPNHLSPDQLHLHNRFSDIIPHNIFNYFHTLASAPIVPSPTVSSRSAEAIQRRKKRCNQLRKLRLAEKQSMFSINRTITPPWTLTHVKTYLQNKHLPFAKISPIRHHQVRIRFNNALTLKANDSSLPTDIFSPGNFSQVFPS